MIVPREIINSLRAYLSRKFSHLRWGIDSIPERVSATASDDIMNERARSKRYPVRALRYWWARSAILDELRKTREELTIVDLGCNRGNIKRFVGDAPGARWIGLDWQIPQDALEECGYSETHECDFDRPLPLESNSADVVVFLHVIEHLPRPHFTMAEIGRILKPGGLLVAGSPVAPLYIAGLRELVLRKKMKRGMIELGGHINSMDCDRWKRLSGINKMNIEKLTGTFLVRCSKSPLENMLWWTRLNQLWGALFPGLGGEVYLLARKQHPSENAAAASLRRRGLLWHMLRPATATALVLMLASVVGMDMLLESRTKASMIDKLWLRYADGVNHLHILRDPDLGSVAEDRDIEIVDCHSEISAQLEEARSAGLDSYFLVSENSCSATFNTLARLKLNRLDHLDQNGERFYLFSEES